jgi:hypothetical protein
MEQGRAKPNPQAAARLLQYGDTLKGIRHCPRKVEEEPVECRANSQAPLLGLPERFLA